MCEPVSIAICVGLICCCCCVTFIIMATLGSSMAVLMNTAAELFKCVNDTLGPSFDAAYQKENCARYNELGCQEKFEEANKRSNGTSTSGRRMLANNTPVVDSTSDASGGNSTSDEDPQILQVCHMLASKCFCDVVEEIMSTHQAGLEEPLKECCTSLEDLKGNFALAAVAGPAAEMCEQIAGNVSEMVVEVHGNCTRGELPNSESFEMLEGKLQSGGEAADLESVDFAGDSTIQRFSLPSSDKFSQQFRRIEQVLRPSHEVVQPAAVLGGGAVVALVAASLVFRRKVRAPEMRMHRLTMNAPLVGEVE